MTSHDPGQRDSWLVLVLAAAALLLALWFYPAKAHEWYDHDCCHAMDCSPVQSTAQVQLAGEKLPTLVVTTIHGTAPMTQQTKVRPSKDNALHACITASDNGPFLRCLYLPPSN